MSDLFLKIYIKVNEIKRKFLEEKSGAAVLETVLLIVMAIVIIGAILQFVVKGPDGEGLLTTIFNKIREMLDLTPE